MAAADEEVIENFHGVYMLYCTNPKFLGRTYIGYTVNPNRRVNQHNKGCQFGGARRTSNKGPWDMVVIIHGFPSDVAALRFEWAWQHPHRSRRLKHVTSTKTTRRTVAFCLRIAAEMMNVGPWNRLGLIVRWLKPEYQQDLPIAIPKHMPIMRGSLVTKKVAAEACSSDDTVKVVCRLCKREVTKEMVMKCLSSECRLTVHTTCLASHFLRFCNSSHIIPVSGQCPKCKRECLWSDLVRKKKGCNVD